MSLEPSLVVILQDEVLLHILSFVEAIDVVRVGRCCHVLHRLAGDESLWRRFCELEGWSNAKAADSPPDETWFQLYRRKRAWWKAPKLSVLVFAEPCSVFAVRGDYRLMFEKGDVVAARHDGGLEYTSWLLSHGPRNRILALDIEEDIVATVARTGPIVVWSLELRAIVRFHTIRTNPDSAFVSVAVRCGLIAAGSTLGFVSIWSSEDGDLRGHHNFPYRRDHGTVSISLAADMTISCVSISRNGDRVAAGTASGRICAWIYRRSGWSLAGCVDCSIGDAALLDRLCFGRDAGAVVFSAVMPDPMCEARIGYYEFGRPESLCISDDLPISSSIFTDGHVLIWQNGDSTLGVRSLRTGKILHTLETGFVFEGFYIDKTSHHVALCAVQETADALYALEVT